MSDERLNDTIAIGHLSLENGPRMSGVARESGNYFDCPLISQVEGGLYQGGCADGLQLTGFDFVLSLYPWESYKTPPTTELMGTKMYDDHNQGFDQVDELAQAVVSRLEQGKTVLVHCQAGLNRSGLVTGRALMLMGYTSDEAIALLRKRSPEVLCNPAFEAHLRSLDAA